MIAYSRVARFLSKEIEKKLREKFKLHKRSIEHMFNFKEDFGIAQLTLHEGFSCVGKTLASSDFGKDKILILPVGRDKERILVPRGNHKLHAGGNLICCGSYPAKRDIFVN